MTEHGICAKCKKSVGCPYADDRITGCKNFVLEPELKLTSKEWLRQCNTEQLAEWLQEHMDCSNCDCNKDLCYKGYDCCKLAFLEWLKQPHHEKE